MAKKDGKEKGTYNYNDNFCSQVRKNYTKITGMFTNIIIRAMRSLLLQLQVPTNASHIQETETTKSQKHGVPLSRIRSSPVPFTIYCLREDHLL